MSSGAASLAQPGGGGQQDPESEYGQDQVVVFSHEGDGENTEHLNSMDLHDVKTELEKDAEKAEVCVCVVILNRVVEGIWVSVNISESGYSLVTRPSMNGMCIGQSSSNRRLSGTERDYGISRTLHLVMFGTSANLLMLPHLRHIVYHLFASSPQVGLRVCTEGESDYA